MAKHPHLADTQGLFGPAPPATSETGYGHAPAVPGAEGHRARMRDRLLRAGPDALADHEVLEMTLFLALPRRDTKPIARALLARFRSFAGCIAAAPQELREIDGLGEAGIAALKTIQAGALRLARAEVIDQPVLATWQRLMEYLTAVLARERVEHFRVLYLDTRNRLIADEPQGRGTVNATPVYPRDLVRRACDRADPGAQPPERRPDALAAGHPDDARHPRRRRTALGAAA
jgi:DNA repair protein RadC